MANAKTGLMMSVFSGLATGIADLAKTGLSALKPGKKTLAVGAGLAAVPAVGLGALEVEQKLRGSNSALGRLQQNEANHQSAVQTEGRWTGIRETIAGFLEMINRFIGSEKLAGIIKTLKDTTARPSQDRSISEDFSRLTGGDGVSTAAVLAGPAAGIAVGVGGLAYAATRKGTPPTNTPPPVDPDINPSGGAGKVHVNATGPKLKGKFAIGAAVVGTGVAVGAGLIGGTSSAEAAEADPAAPDTITTPEASPAVLSGVEQAMMGGIAAEATYGAIKGTSMVATKIAADAVVEAGAGTVAKRVPILGGLVTAGFTLYSAFNYAAAGEFGKAGTELVAGTGEALINTTGAGLLGLGDGFREATRAGVIAVAGEEYAPDKSGLRVLGEYVTGTGDFAPVPGFK